MIPIPFSYILVYAVSSLFCKIALSFLYVMLLTVLSDLKLIQGEPFQCSLSSSQVREDL